MEKLPVSVCMIVRDEAEVLAVALASVVDWAAQVVVVDTGSRDSSVDVAQRHGALVSRIEWKDDFAAARNVSMDLASQPWVLILDADEWIDPEQVPDIAALCEADPDHAHRFAQHNYVDTPSVAGLRVGDIPPVWGLEAVGWIVARQMRLVPNRPDVRYEGAVHETLVPSLERAGIVLSDAEIAIHHVGKLRAAAVMARKKRLYKRLGELKLATDPSGMARMELGIQCSELGEHEDARRLLGEAVDLLPSGPERSRAVACLASQIELFDGADAAIGFLRAELGREARYPDVWERLGLVCMRARQYARAAEVLERAIEIFPDANSLLRLAAESELAVRQFARAEALYATLTETSGDTGMGVAGRAVARAGQGDALDLVACLASDREAIAAAAVRGANHWLDPAWVFDTAPGAWRAVSGAVSRPLFARAYEERSRAGWAHAAQPTLQRATRCGLEAVARTLRIVRVPPELPVRVARMLAVPLLDGGSDCGNPVGSRPRTSV